MKSKLPTRPKKVSLNKLLFSTKELADIFSVSTQTIYLWIKKFNIPARKMGRRIVFLKKDIEIFVQSLPQIHSNKNFD